MLNVTYCIRTFYYRRQLQIFLSTEEQITESRERDLRYLIESWRVGAAIRPLDAFDLGTSSFLSLLGLIFTYLIVLWQFKIAV